MCHYFIGSTGVVNFSIRDDFNETGIHRALMAAYLRFEKVYVKQEAYTWTRFTIPASSAWREKRRNYVFLCDDSEALQQTTIGDLPLRT